MSGFDQFEIIKPEFRDLIISNVGLELLSSGHRWTEGPIWFPAHNTLLFSDIPNEKICRWTFDGQNSLFRANSSHANGNTRDLQGRLTTCEHGSRSVTRTEHDGSITTLAEQYDGKKLNSPNDVVVKSDGTIWFTDPIYGIKTDYEGHKAPSEQPCNGVYKMDANGENLTRVSEDFVQPNGLAFSKDEKTLFVSESGKSEEDAVPAVIRSFDVSDDNSLSNLNDFAEIDNGIPDGFRVDEHDNIWSSAGDGVHCFSPQGELIGKIKLPQTVSNLTFGGPRGNILFITATTEVYSIYLNVRSANGR